MNPSHKPSFFWRLLPLLMGFVPALLFGVISGWFVHKLIDLGQVPWQSMIKLIVALVILMVVAALVARAVFRLLVPRIIEKFSAGVQNLAKEARQAPQLLTTGEFWLDRVWPVIREGKALVFGWVGVYTTMAAVVALAALLCQTGSLAVAYLQIDRLDKQNERIDQQIEQSKQQNLLLTAQNTLLQDQNLLSESARRAALLQIVGDVLTSIDTETRAGSQSEVSGTLTAKSAVQGANVQITERADERTYAKASPRLIGRLAAACSSLRGYRYLGDDGKPIPRPRSPERGFILRSVVAAGIDVTGLIDQKADFSYAEAEDAVIEYYRLEPTPLAASSVPGTRGLQLAESQLEGVSFRGSRLGEANFKHAWLVNAAFSGCRLVGASFEQATAGGAKFVSADLRNASFSGADLSAADFSTTDVLGDTLLPDAAAFNMADLTDVDLAGAFVASADWLEQLARIAHPGTSNQNGITFKSEDWKIVPAVRLPVVRHEQDEIMKGELKAYQWRIANADGSLESDMHHGGTVITPRYDKYTPDPSPPMKK